MQTQPLGSWHVSKKARAFAVLQPTHQDKNLTRPPHITGSSDTRLKQAALKITVMDRATCAPICGAGVLVAELSAFMKGKPRNTGSTKQTASKTDSRGRVQCTVLSSRWWAAYSCLALHIVIRVELKECLGPSHLPLAQIPGVRDMPARREEKLAI
jgi:hypothetical protein